MKKVYLFFGIFLMLVFFVQAQPKNEEKSLSARKYQNPKELIELEKSWQKVKGKEERLNLLNEFRTKHSKSISVHQIYQDYFEWLKKDKNELLSEYKEFIQKNPDDPIYYYLYGRLLNNSSALEYFKKAIELNKNFYWGYIGLGYYYSSLIVPPDYQQAIKQFYQAIAIDNSNPAAFLNLAEIYEKQGEIEKANKMYQLLLICDPENDFYFRKYLNKYFIKNDLKKIIELTEERLKKYPNNKQSIELLTQLYFQEKNYSKAIEYLNLLISKQSKIDYSAYALLSIAYAQINQKEKALDAFEKALASPFIYYDEEVFSREEFNPIKNEPRFKEAIRKLQEKYGINQPAEIFVAKDLEGKEINLEKLRGKVVLLDFWATWCRPCIQEMPQMKRIYNQFKDENFVFIGLSLDQRLENLKEFLKREKLSWSQIWLERGFNNKIAQLYRIKAIPATYLIDKKGILRKVNLRGEALKKTIEDLIKE